MKINFNFPKFICANAVKVHNVGCVAAIRLAVVVTVANQQHPYLWLKQKTGNIKKSIYIFGLGVESSGIFPFRNFFEFIVHDHEYDILHAALQLSVKQRGSNQQQKKKVTHTMTHYYQVTHKLMFRCSRLTKFSIFCSKFSSIMISRKYTCS